MSSRWPPPETAEQVASAYERFDENGLLERSKSDHAP
jgi:hypothetical protein